MDPPLPAPFTKHLATLHHPLPRSTTTLALRQQAHTAEGESTGTTGSTLWLGGQVLSAYLASLPQFKPGPNGKRKRALELGAGIGYCSLVLASQGYDVVATDIEPALSTVLAPNVHANAGVIGGIPGAGAVMAQECDWLKIQAEDEAGVAKEEEENDLIVTADTIYANDMAPPLWAALKRYGRRVGGDDAKSPTIYVALERRDPKLTDFALQMGRDAGCELRRVSAGRMGKSIQQAGWGWDAAEWSDVEIWKGKWRS